MEETLVSFVAKSMRALPVSRFLFAHQEDGIDQDRFSQR